MKIIVVVLLLIAMLTSSFICHIYHYTSTPSVLGSDVVPLSTKEMYIYNVCKYIICISGFTLAVIWIYDIIKNPNKYWVLTIKTTIMITLCIIPNLDSKMSILSKTVCFAITAFLDSLYLIPIFCN